MATGPSNYGRKYWGVKTGDLSKSGEIYVSADRAEVTPNGDLVFIGHSGEDELTVLALAKGEWRAFFAASTIDGAGVAVEHWDGEVSR